MLFNNKKKTTDKNSNYLITSSFGVLGGLSTMIGNAAGPVMTIYFLSIGFKKNKFIGTAAWFFLLVNIFKVPFHIYAWKTINLSIIYFGLTFTPLIILGALSGVWVVKKIPEKPYRIFLIFSVFLSILKLLFIF
jgi:uncharacterized membrane protein YfcA